MQVCKKSLSLLIIVCMVLIALPKTTLASGYYIKYMYHQPIGVVKGENGKNIEYVLEYTRWEDADNGTDDYYKVSVKTKETTMQANLDKKEDVKTLIILDKITDETGSWPVKRMAGFGDNVNFFRDNKKILPNLITLYLPQNLTEITNNSLLGNLTLQNVYYAGNETQWKQILELNSDTIDKFYIEKANNEDIKRTHPFKNATMHYNYYPNLEISYGEYEYDDRWNWRLGNINVNVKDTLPSETQTNNN